MKQSVPRLTAIGYELYLLLITLVVFINWQPAFAKTDSRSHHDVWLKNEQGEKIIPARNASDPYSPKKTCGSCHGYASVTSGYHFRQAPSRPSLMSPFSEGLSKKPYSGQTGLPLYDWIGAGGKMTAAGEILSVAVGWFHPGGGILEYDRKVDGSLDLSETLSRKEKGNQSAAGGDFLARFTPDGKSHFRESGILEADCLICHMDRYRMEDRNREIQKRNYRWAATAGAGLGRIEGSIFSYGNLQAGPGREDFLSGTWNFSRRPVVRYNWGRGELFTAEGKLKGKAITGRVRSQNCLRCHDLLEAVATGSGFSRESDAHAKAGLDCTDCHVLLGRSKSERLQHQIAGKQFPGAGEIAMKTCGGCHLEGKYRQTRRGLPSEARRPTQAHARKFPRSAFHFYVVSCQGCHATAQPRRGAYLVDMSAGEKLWYSADSIQPFLAVGELGKKSAKSWKPWIERVDAGKGEGTQYAPYLPRAEQWFGRKLPDGTIMPLSLPVVRNVLRGVQNISIAKAGRKSIGSPDEIRRALASFHGRGYRDCVFVADHIYELKGGRIEKGKAPGPNLYPSAAIHHSVVPLERKLTYGSKGCLDCHGKKSEFFTKMKIVNPSGFLMRDYPKPKEPNAVEQMREWGFSTVPSAMPAR